MNAQLTPEVLTEVPLLALPDPTPAPDAPALPPTVRPPDRIPCTFTGKGLNIGQWVRAKGFYEAAAAWRFELGSDLASVRFNRRVLAGFLRQYRGIPPMPRIPPYAHQAARAGMERAIWMLTGRAVKLRVRVKPLQPALSLAAVADDEGDGTLLLFH